MTTERELEEAAQRQVDEARQEMNTVMNERDPREESLEKFATTRAKEEADKGRLTTLVVIEIDHSDGHASNVVHGDLNIAVKLCRHLSNELAMRMIQEMAKELGMSIDNEVPTV